MAFANKNECIGVYATEETGRVGTHHTLLFPPFLTLFSVFELICRSITKNVMGMQVRDTLFVESCDTLKAVLNEKVVMCLVI